MQAVAFAEDGVRCHGIKHSGAQAIECFAEIVAVEVDDTPVALLGRVQDLREILQEQLALAGHVRTEHQHAQLIPLRRSQKLLADMPDDFFAGIELRARQRRERARCQRRPTGQSCQAHFSKRSA